MEEVTIGVITFLSKGPSKSGLESDIDDGVTSNSRSKLISTNAHRNLPNSIKIHGRFQNLINLKHKSLCEYIDIHRKHDRITLVMEHYMKNLADSTPAELDIDMVVYQLLTGLDYLHKRGIIHRNLQPKNILIKKNGDVCLSNFGLFYMTNFGEYVSFPVGYPLYLSIESLSSLSQSYTYSTINDISKTDIWMLGMCILDWITKFSLLSHKRNDVNSLLDFVKNMNKYSMDMTPLDYILKTLNVEDLSFYNISDKVIEIIKNCLILNPSERPSAEQLIECFYGLKDIDQTLEIPSFWDGLHSDFDVVSSVNYYLNENHVYDHPLNSRPFKEIFYLWKISGGNLHNELIEKNIFKTYPPILTLPQVIYMNGEIYSPQYSLEDVFDDRITVLPLENLYQLLRDIEYQIYFPIIHMDEEIPSSCVDTVNLPKCIKERITVYQLYRMVIFRKLLLQGYPYTRKRIINEAKIDIPPLYRNLTWAALLDVPVDYKEKYESLDKQTPHSIDRQIDVDIPRCHQYSEIMSSPEAHIKLKRVLKAWVSNQTSLVYWQGLDSLLAPFLSLNMDNEALAHACLEKFVNKFCYNIFIKNNSLVMQEYLFVFFHLLAYHDPYLFMHMKEINFEPELFAIPWFLTMFSHVFPLEKIYHLWDTLLLGSSVLPMCFAVAILVILREKLINSNFNECISIFSNVTGVNVESCMSIGMDIYKKTPLSVAVRSHDNPDSFIHNDVPSQFLQFPDKQPLDLSFLKNENCPRISCKDAIIILYDAIIEKFPHFLDEICTTTTTMNQSIMVSLIVQKCSHKSITNFSVLFVDIRTKEEYYAGHLPGSINRPFNGLSLVHSSDINLPECIEDKPIIICSNKVSEASKVGSLLVMGGYRYVSVLDIPMHSLAEYGVFVTSE